MKVKIRLNLTFGNRHLFYRDEVVEMSEHKRFIIWEAGKKNNMYFQYFGENDGVRLYREINKAEYLKFNNSITTDNKYR